MTSLSCVVSFGATGDFVSSDTSMYPICELFKTCKYLYKFYVKSSADLNSQ